MNRFKAFSRRSMIMIFGIMAILALIVDGAVYFCVTRFFSIVPVSAIQKATVGSPELGTFIDRGVEFFFTIKMFLVPATGVLFFFFAVIAWIVLRLIFKASVAKYDPPMSGKKSVDSEPESLDRKKEAQAERQRYYLHLIGALQREGRLVDFLEEDISPYSDEQVGAAVRNIHENCRKTIHKYLSPKPVIMKSEGENIIVEIDFDPGAVKLTGNVAGDPPFNGILRHPGWRAERVDLPRLSASGDFSILAPAEVEIE
ncbi:MAG: DUF2760 domain-containing protein [Deltaproteobacteria bacterium]|nr:DUF2760 domain-containing protein [Deltaproteobacteria bacterium]